MTARNNRDKRTNLNRLDGWRVLYVGGFHFPNGDAAAARVLGIGKALREVGIKVTFAGFGESERPEDQQPDGSYAYQGFPYVTVERSQKGPLSPLKRLQRYVSVGSETQKWLQSIDLSSVGAVVMYNPLTGHHLRLLPLLRKQGIPIVVDSTEWHDPRHYPGGRFGLHRWDVELSMRYLNSKASHIILISSFLENFYRAQGAHVLRVPPLVDLNDPKWPKKCPSREQRSPLRVMYAGKPGKKDCLDRILDAFWLLKQEGVSVVLELVGPTASEVARCGPLAKERIRLLDSSLVIHGHLPAPEHALQKISEADLLIVVKYPGRSAQAQFPTKLVEYMAVGCPVLVNLTSDIAEYVRDNIEGIVIPDHEPSSIAVGVRRAIQAGSQLAVMGEASRKRAEEYFDYRRYIAVLHAFFTEVFLSAQNSRRRS